MNGSLDETLKNFNETLTQEQIDAPSYFDWDNETLGRFLRAHKDYLKGWRKDGWDKVGIMASNMMLVIMCKQANVSYFSNELSDVTFGERGASKWKITVEKIS